MYAEARQATGLTKVAAAELAGMPETSVRKLEKGSQSPTLKTLRKYAESLMPLQFLVRRYPDIPPCPSGANK